MIKPHLTRIVFIAAALALTTSRCVELPSSPVLPTFDVQGSIPLIDRMFTVADFVAKDTSLTTLGNGGLLYESRERFDPWNIDTIKIQPEASSQQAALGTFQVLTPVIPPVAMTYEQITGLPPPPGSVIIPPGAFTLPQSSLGPLASFQYIEFDSGSISVTVQNTLPFPVEFTSPLTIKNNVLSPVDTAVIASLAFSGLISGNGGTQVRSANLAGVTMLPSLKIMPSDISTPGSSGAVTVNPVNGLIIQISIVNAKVRAAKARIPSQPVLHFADSTFVVDDSVTIVSAFFRSGSFSLFVENFINVDVGVSVKVDQLLDRVNGQPFEINRQFAGAGSVTIPVNLSPLKYQSLLDSIGTRATFTVGISTIGNTDSSREVKSTDIVRVSIVPGPPVIMQQVTGRITPTLVNINAGASGFGLGEISEKFEGDFAFDSVQIALRVSTSSGFPADYDVRFVGIDRRSNPPKRDSILVPPPIGSSQRRIFPATSPVTSILLDNTAGLNGFLAKFFPHLPDTFIIRGTMLVNPSDVYGTPDGKQSVYDTSKVYTSVDINFPVRLGVTNGAVRDTIPMDVSEKFPRQLAASTRSGTMFFEIENGLPFVLSFRSALLGVGPVSARDSLLLIPSDGPRLIESGSVDASGSVVSPTTSRFSIEFSGPEAQKFESGRVLQIELLVESANSGSIVNVKSGDAVRVRASGNLVYQVNKPR